MATIESFMQYTLCELCRVSHNVGKKHVYSKKHQQIVKNVLAKYLKKVHEAKQFLKKPEVHDLLWEDGAKVWCYFCAAEIEKHGRNVDDALSVRSYNFLLHLATPAHEAACKSFFWKNKISKASVKLYVISSDIVSKAEPLINAAEKAYLEKMERLHQKNVSAILKADKQREDTVMKARLEYSSAVSEHTSSQPQPGCSSWSSVNGISSSREQRAIPQGMTGNIHTGAKPPWLYEDSEEEDEEEPTTAKRPRIGEVSKAPIGPTMEDFQKHLFLEKRKKLNPNRVGANFDHFSETSEEWLPSFGRVWNFGRRWQSRSQYRKEEKAAGKWKKLKES
ncbi:centrosomal AT-AC splicing factor isoform X1 [Rhipicephalus sanguineus]|uniref:centrosomal AT-AC splicing factor isoform X1 n=1 Tax=Rhipicephalus sanguineus TaxID=34632 RepID=UPI0018947C58|nr:centrosomal AT-AC splicing factor isoform X1 [Rhipicephalus sanguineus]